MPTWSQRVKLLFFFLYFGEKISDRKKEKKNESKEKIKPSRLRTIPHASAHLSLWSRCLPATKTHDITIQAQTSSEALLLWSKEDLLLVFPMSSLTPQKVPVTTSAARRPCTWWRSEAILFGQSRRRVAEPLL